MCAQYGSQAVLPASYDRRPGRDGDSFSRMRSGPRDQPDYFIGLLVSEPPWGFFPKTVACPAAASR